MRELKDHLDFFRSIYLGDRCFLGWTVDAQAKVVRLHVDEISRVRSEVWDYYNDENIQNGSITFTGVVSMECIPSGPLPNDFIEIESVVGYGPSESRLFVCSVVMGSVSDDAVTTQVNMKIVATDAYLESPDKPGELIR